MKNRSNSEPGCSQNTGWPGGEAILSIKIIPVFFFILCVLLPAGAFGKSDFPDPSKWSEPRLFHRPFQKEFEKRVVLSESDFPAGLLTPVHSENKAYYYMAVRPDFSSSGPWSTSLFIYSEREKMTRIDLIDHASYEVRAEWINEKLLFIRVWWGRMLGSDFIFDVEQNKIIWEEMVVEGSILFRQYMVSKDGLSTNQNGRAGQISGSDISVFKMKLENGTPQEKEDVLNAFMDANIVELVPDVIEAILDGTASPRQGDTGWATVHHHAATAMSRFAQFFDGLTLEERGRDKFSFFDDAGIGDEDRRREIHDNWAAWWKENREDIWLFHHAASGD